MFKNNRDVLLIDLEAGKSKVKVPGDSVFGEVLFPSSEEGSFHVKSYAGRAEGDLLVSFIIRDSLMS